MPIQPTLLLNILLFPLAFAVNAAYARRESALAHFAYFKSSVLNMYVLPSVLFARSIAIRC